LRKDIQDWKEDEIGMMKATEIDEQVVGETEKLGMLRVQLAAVNIAERETEIAALLHFSVDDAERASVLRNRALRIASEVEATGRRLELLPVARKFALDQAEKAKVGTRASGGCQHSSRLDRC
jgi:hypothetical protein